MSAVIEKLSRHNENINTGQTISYNDPAVVIIGAGPVGMHFVEKLMGKTRSLPVIVYGGEPYRPYDRVRLTSYLAGDIYREDLELVSAVSEQAPVEYRYNCPVVWIDRKRKVVIDADSGEQKYSKLVLATGSTPYVPCFGNRKYEGIYTFRTLHEADVLLARKTRSCHTVIIGGGLLGLETARAMQKYNTRITIVEHSRWLMMNQLDEKAAEYLQSFATANGINFILDDSIASVSGNQRVESVNLRSGKRIECDTLIIAAGIRPNIQLAMDAGLTCHKGVCINDYLQTSDENIFAIGECAEHDDSVYGLVKPGLDQAAVLAGRLAGGKARYRGSLDATRLKVAGQSVFSCGRTGVDEASRSTVTEYIYSSKKTGIYRKIRVFGNRIIGVIAVGEWHESALIQQTIQKKKKVWFWHLWRFKATGNIWGDAESLDVSTWPSATVVCNCTGVTRGQLSKAINNGCETVACLQKTTQASGVCGSCKPLLAEMLGKDLRAEPVRAWRSLLAVSMVTLAFAALLIITWRIPYADTVQTGIRWDELWRNSLFKQITGFVMLGLVIVGLVISLRKRVSVIDFGDYNLWRIAHAVLGIFALAALITHTGFRLGNELNFILTMNFLLLAIAGANAGTVVSTEHQQLPAVAKKQRSRWNRVHLLLFWPLPVLLGFHVAKTYYF